MHLIRIKEYGILLDCGLIQTGADIYTNYKLNQAQLKKIKPNDIQYIILSHSHIDHVGLVPALIAQGCQAHIYVPKGSLPFLKLLWEDSMKIFTADCQKIERKHGQKATPFYTQSDINNTLNRCIEVPYYTNQPLFDEDNYFKYYDAGHIIHSAQIYLNLLIDENIVKRIGYTGDIGGNPYNPQPWSGKRNELPFVDILIGENTYNSPVRPNKPYDRRVDNQKIINVIEESNKVLIPCFSLMRTQIMLSNLLHLWEENKIPKGTQIYVDSPLAEKFCRIWPESYMWDFIMNEWPNLHFIKEWSESVELQKSNEKCVIISASGFLSGGRVVSHLKTVLPYDKNTILFCGFSGENNLASQIKSKQKEVVVDGESIPNRANIVELHSFSSHASYEDLIQYYTHSTTRFNKLCLVHGNQQNKIEFAKVLQEELSSNGISSKVVAINNDTKMNF